MFFLKLLVTVVIADLVAGLVHWAEDAYARPDSSWLGRIARDNLLHHSRPREFLKKSWWQSSGDLLLVGALVIAATLLAGVFNGWILLGVLLAANANQIHKWAHSSRREQPAIAHWLQRARILQTPRHHARHHSGRKNTHYCVITNFVNPVLETIRFWTALEWLVLRTTGVARRNDGDWNTPVPDRF